jgi:hypothetical protein
VLVTLFLDCRLLSNFINSQVRQFSLHNIRAVLCISNRLNHSRVREEIISDTERKAVLLHQGKKRELLSAWVEKKKTATRSWDRKKRKSVVVAGVAGVAAAAAATAIPPENEPASDGQLSQRSRNDVESQTPTNHGAGSTWYVLALSRFYLFC